MVENGSSTQNGGMIVSMYFRTMSSTGGMDDMATTLSNIDMAFGTWDIWNRVKNYINTWFLFAEAMNEYAYIINGKIYISDNVLLEDFIGDL